MGVTAIPPDRQLIIWHPAETPPAGYIKANGATLSRDVYAWLFSKIGTTFGAGDGVTTFATPDLRGEFLRGLDDGRGVDIGRVLGSAQSDDMKTHSHTIYRGSGTGSQTGLTAGSSWSSILNPVSGAASSVGGTETRPRNVAGLYCIAYAP